MKRFLITFILVILAGIALDSYLSSNLVRVDNIQLEEEIENQEIVDREVVTPPPLHGPIQETSSNLTLLGIVAETNSHREINGLPALSINTQLNKAAEIKVDDMFIRQYFEHESPTGEGPGDLAKIAGYDYLTVGENLALGNYEDDKVLVQAWMDSPGHRENILNIKFTEIGVAVKQGTYEGQTAWMAVQEFGRPASLCSSPSESLEAEINENQTLLEEMEEELVVKKQEMDNMKPRRGPAYNRKVDEYNELVGIYNELLEETKVLISEYNSQVNEYNVCIQ